MRRSARVTEHASELPPVWAPVLPVFKAPCRRRSEPSLRFAAQRLSINPFCPASLPPPLPLRKPLPPSPFPFRVLFRILLDKAQAGPDLEIE